MKKIISLISLFFLSALMSACTSNNSEEWITESDEQSSIEKISVTQEPSSESQSTSSDKLILSLLDSFTSNEMKQEKFLDEFVTEFLNFNSIDERNESLENKMTKEAFEENGMDVKVHADYESKGEVLNVYKSLTKENFYYIDSIATSKNQEMGISIYVELVEESPANLKISQLIVI